jgi:hypothetical protein
MKEVQLALEGAKSNLDERLNTSVVFDVVGFDACLMGMVEVAYALRNVANYMVGSEQTEPAAGWPYDAILNALAVTPSSSPQDLASIIPTEYVNFYSGGSNITQSAVNIAKLDNLITKVDDFTNAMNTEWQTLKAARDSSLRYNNGCPYYVCWGVDLWHFADNVHNQVSSQNIKTAALDVKNGIDDFVISEHHSPDMAASHGIALYFPSDMSEFTNDPDHPAYQQNNQYYPLDFVIFHNWDDWLQLFYANLGTT